MAFERTSSSEIARLSSWLAAREEDLAHHFADLAQRRSPRGHSVFALEHPFNVDDVRRLAASLSELTVSQKSLARYPLSWVVTASEQAYEFDGLEYWRTFGNAVPGWALCNDRHQLRQWFRDFAKRFRGTQPVGPWAGHYAFICWPVTHALLPRDLQRQLARALYQGRFELSSALDAGPDATVHLVQRYTDQPSSRFDAFLEQPELVARVVFGLVQVPCDAGDIVPTTLDRISGDLNRRRDTREWIREAKERLRRVHFRGPVIGAPREGRRPSSPSTAPRPVQERPQPRLLLERRNDGQWRLNLAPASIATAARADQTLAQKIPLIRLLIKGTEVAIPAQALMAAQPREQPLTTWPDALEPIALFDPEHLRSSLLRSIEGDYTFRLHGAAVFLVRGDGSATLVPTRTMRAGQSYIVVAPRAEAHPLGDLGTTTTVACDCVQARRINLPSVISDLVRAQLERAGISVVDALTIEPVGLYPRRWQREGMAELLLEEPLILRIERDRPFDTVLVYVGKCPGVTLDASQGSATYLHIPSLSLGSHTIVILAGTRSEDASTSTFSSKAEINVQVREPSAWQPGRLHSQAVIIQPTLLEPTFDDLLSERFAVHAVGNQTRKLRCSLVTQNRDGEDQRQFLLLDTYLPVTPPRWLQTVRAPLRRVEGHALEVAATAELRFDCEDLGMQRLSVALPRPPLRWVLLRATTPTLQLVNDSEDDVRVVRRSTFECPWLFEDCAPELARTYEVGEMCSPGLYLAQTKKTSTSIIVTGRPTGHGLQALLPPIDSSALKQVADFGRVIIALRTWHGARVMATVAMLWKQRVRRVLHLHLLSLVCGSRWQTMEEKLQGLPAEDVKWDRVEAAVSHPASYAIVLTQKYFTCSNRDELPRIHCAVSQSFRLTGPAARADLAWRVAAAPWALTDDEAGSIKPSKAMATMVRGARLMVLSQQLKRR